MKRILGFVLLLLVGVFNAACFSIEKEIFLNADGSGELVLHISMPDMPDDVKSTPVGDKDPAAEIEKFKRDIMTKLPPTVKLKEAKQVKQNGVLGFYAVLEFKQLRDTEKILTSFGESGIEDFASGQSEWTVQFDKQADHSSYTERFFINVDESKKTTPPPAKNSTSSGKPSTTGKRATQKPATADPNIFGDSKEFEQKMQMLALALVKMRFVLHAPSPIKATNADILLKDRIAVWNCSLLNFAKDKKPIEMKATF
ncbi:MAG: hypothetical protein AB1757_02235 [Acidobacteriota bacterium]